MCGMNKKILIIVLLVILLSVVFWFIWEDLKTENDNIISSGEQTVGGVTYGIATTTFDIDISVEDNVLFKKTALEIADMPIIFSVQTTKENKEKNSKRIEEINNQIKEDYQHLDLLLEAGSLRQVVGDYEGAVRTWEFASAVFPKNYTSFQNTGFVYGFYLKDYDKSEENYLKSLENDPTNIQVYLDLVDIYTFSNQMEKIPVFLKTSLKNIGHSNQLFLKASLAKYYVDIKDNTNAIKYYEEVLAGDPSNEDIKQEIERLKTL
ncbi:tetratricopeptide repeat protein [Patescibacteria group bacterium]|nr:tetratricopeptide repeat protein [Patescibacteria group bacterium]